MFLYLTYSVFFSLFSPFFSHFLASFPPCPVSICEFGHCRTITFSYAKNVGFFSSPLETSVLFCSFFCGGGGVHCRCGLLTLCLWCGGLGRGVGYLSYPWLLLCHVRAGHSHAPHADCVLALINWSSTDERSACLPPSLAHSPTSNLLIL